MESKLKPGEKGFSLLLLLLGIGFLFESIKMFMKEPTASSYGALPLFLSVSIIVLMIKIFIEDNKKQSENTGISFSEKVKESLRFVFTKDIIVIFSLMIVYCMSLLMGLGFEISTSIFLFVSMSYLIRKQYIKNILYTVVSMAFILLIFKTIFQVILP